MIKKIMLVIVILICVGLVGTYFYCDSQIGKLMVVMQIASQDIFIRACKEDSDCIRDIKELYPNCSNKFYVTNVSPLNFNKEYSRFITNVSKCMRDKSDLELPNFWEYAEEYLKESKYKKE